MRYEAIINRDSGSGIFRDMEQQNRLKRVFSDRGHQLDLQIVFPKDLTDAVKKAAASQSEVLLIGGGDGTINSAAKLLNGTDKALGIIPLGTFNLEARDLKIALDPFEAAEQLIDAEIRKIDLMRVNNEVCLCATVIGFYPALAKSREDFHGKSWWRKSIQNRPRDRHSRSSLPRSRPERSPATAHPSSAGLALPPSHPATIGKAQASSQSATASHQVSSARIFQNIKAAWRCSPPPLDTFQETSLIQKK